MTREEEIKKIACAFAIDEVKDTCNPASKRGLLYAGFVSGAEWADRTMIDKACKWLKDYAHIYVSETTGDVNEDELINAFSKAMKGGEE